MPRRLGRADGWALLAIVLLGLAMGMYFCGLNRLLYTHKAPFYDSMAYYHELASVMERSHREGLLAAMGTHLHQTTVFMPLLVGALLGPWMEPTRTIAVWVQIVELLGLLVSTYYLWRRVYHQSPFRSFAFLLPFCGFARFYAWEGGFSDYRMDLSLMLMFGTTVVWYWIARESESMGHFLMLGLVAGIACLFRATAPAYLLVALAPWAAYDLFSSMNRRRLIVGLGMAGAVWLVVAGWYFWINYDYLRYYYMQWNTDAQAKLPLGKALKHFEYAGRHVGFSLALGLGAAWGACLVSPRWQQGWANKERSGNAGEDGGGGGNRAATKVVTVGLMWVALSAAAMLCLKGAGLNRFVSMPSAWGGVMLLVWIAVSRRQVPLLRWQTGAFFVLMVFVLLIQAYQGFQSHRPGMRNTMASHLGILEEIAKDVAGRNLPRARFGVLYCEELSTMTLDSVRLFDWTGGRASLLEPHFVFQHLQPAEWELVPGNSMGEKIENEQLRATSEVDYLIVPELETAQWLEQHRAMVANNAHALAVRRAFVESSSWQPISEIIVISPSERVRVYRNRRGE